MLLLLEMAGCDLPFLLQCAAMHLLLLCAVSPLLQLCICCYPFVAATEALLRQVSFRRAFTCVCVRAECVPRSSRSLRAMHWRGVARAMMLGTFPFNSALLLRTYIWPAASVTATDVTLLGAVVHMDVRHASCTFEMLSPPFPHSYHLTLFFL